MTPSFDFGGSVGDTQYFVTAPRQLEQPRDRKPDRSLNAIHDHTDQGKFFGYTSTLLDDSTRFSLMSGYSYSKFQIPNNPDQTPLGDFGPPVYNSATLNENEYDTYAFHISRRCRRKASRSTPSLRPISAMRRCISFPMSSATWSSTTSPPMLPAKAISTAPSSTPPTG